MIKLFCCATPVVKYGNVTTTSTKRLLPQSAEPTAQCLTIDQVLQQLRPLFQVAEAHDIYLSTSYQVNSLISQLTAANGTPLQQLQCMVEQLANTLELGYARYLTFLPTR